MARLRRSFCNHYRAMSEHDTCSAGVCYDKFKGLPHSERPCFREPGKEPPGGCDKAEYPTPEQLAEIEAEMKARFENLGKARGAIVQSLGGPWKKGTPGSSGVIDCPVCGQKESLRFSRSGYNGHIHAGCKTEKCVAWME